MRPSLRQNRGRRAQLTGLAAEAAVRRVYEQRGCVVLAERWRGPGGEIDLILQESDVIIFVEVKQADTMASAAERIAPRQVERIMSSAAVYLDGCPKGALTQTRVDVALVNSLGEVEIIENAFG